MIRLDGEKNRFLHGLAERRVGKIAKANDWLVDLAFFQGCHSFASYIGHAFSRGFFD